MFIVLKLTIIGENLCLKLSKWVIAIVVIILIIAGIWYYGTKPATTPTSAELIKIGAVLSLTGAGSFHSQNIKQGADLAVDEINKLGGIDNRQL